MNIPNNKSPDYFEKVSLKTAEEIRRSCEKIGAVGENRYNIKRNGNHIWVKLNLANDDYLAPMLHVELRESENNRTFIKGKFGNGPFLWLLFLALRMASAGIFIAALIYSGFKWHFGQSFNAGLLTMFLMVNVWFALHFFSGWSKRKTAAQMTELSALIEHIAG